MQLKSYVSWILSRDNVMFLCEKNQSGLESLKIILINGGSNTKRFEFQGLAQERVQLSLKKTN